MDIKRIYVEEEIKKLEKELEISVLAYRNQIAALKRILELKPEEKKGNKVDPQNTDLAPQPNKR